LNAGAALTCGDSLSIDEITRGALNVGVAMYVEAIDAADFLHHALAQSRCCRVNGVADDFAAGKR
jgi:hypothetical protein